jgi:hypothetical protein
MRWFEGTSPVPVAVEMFTATAEMDHAGATGAASKSCWAIVVRA